MTASEFRCWLETLADASAVLPASEVLSRLPKVSDMLETSSQEPTLTEPSPLELTWRERLWTAPAETRLGIVELCEGLGRSQSWAYKRTGPKAEDPLPHRLLDGQLVFLCGEIRHWVRTHEESISECPMDSTASERALKVVGAS